MPHISPPTSPLSTLLPLGGYPSWLLSNWLWLSATLCCTHAANEYTCILLYMALYIWCIYVAWKSNYTQTDICTGYMYVCTRILICCLTRHLKMPRMCSKCTSTFSYSAILIFLVHFTAAATARGSCGSICVSVSQIEYVYLCVGVHGILVLNSLWYLNWKSSESFRAC